MPPEQSRSSSQPTLSTTLRTCGGRGGELRSEYKRHDSKPLVISKHLDQIHSPSSFRRWDCHPESMSAVGTVFGALTYGNLNIKTTDIITLAKVSRPGPPKPESPKMREGSLQKWFSRRQRLRAVPLSQRPRTHSHPQPALDAGCTRDAGRETTTSLRASPSHLVLEIADFSFLWNTY